MRRVLMLGPLLGLFITYCSRSRRGRSFGHTVRAGHFPPCGRRGSVRQSERGDRGGDGGPHPQWLEKAKADADIIFSGAE